MDTPDPSRLRISDQDRHHVAEVLREAAGEGRIDLEELDQRLEATYAARTYADLVPITSTCPPPRRRRCRPVPRRPRRPRWCPDRRRSGTSRSSVASSARATGSCPST